MLPSIFGENMMDGDVEVSDLVNTEPFNNYDILDCVLIRMGGNVGL